MNPIAEAVVVQLIVGIVTFVFGSLSTWVIWIGKSLRKAKRDVNCAHQMIRELFSDNKDLSARIECLEKTIYYQGD